MVVIQENHGLNARIEDVTRRAANAGYLSIAPNALASLGGTPQMKMKQEQNSSN